MTKLYIKAANKNLKDAVVLLNNQPITRLKSLKLELDEDNNRIAHLTFYPSAIDANVTGVELKEEPKTQKTTTRKKKGVSK